MKKLFLLLPLLALFVACQPDDDPVAELGYITFANQVEDLTRGDNTITTANLADFDVWGHNDAGIVFSGTKVEKRGDAWTSAVQKTWEPSNTYHFHALAPSGLITNVGEYPNLGRARGLSNFTYANAGDKDLVYAYATRTQGSLLEVNSEPVQLAFEHLLTRVEITFKNSLSKGNITIADVQIIDATKSAELNCADSSIANWTWIEENTGVYNFGATSAIAQGASALAENVQFLFPAATRNYNISFSIAYESEVAETRTAIITDVNFVMGKSYNITVAIEDKDIVTEQYGISFFVAEVKEWGSNIEINATLNGETDTPENPETPEVVTHEYVDLGLPSGLKWATCNVGAESPEEYGDYFAWGEVEPQEYYDWETYKYNTSSYELTKYCTDSEYGKDGFVDYNTILDPEDDAATVNWGGDWRMPTTAEQQELIDNCTWDWTIQNGVNGHEVTGPNGNSIFLPAAGYMDEGTLYDAGSDGYYWSSSLVTDYPIGAYFVSFYLDDVDWYDDSRCVGQSVRPVYGESSQQPETQRYTISVYSHDNSRGTVSGGGTYDEGSQVTIRATAKSGYKFKEWNDGNTDNPRVVTVKKDAIYTAYFEEENNLNAGHEYVDLGLPSGLKWATCNVGAESPEEYGDYFAWGEVEPKEYYDWSTYKYCVDDYDNLTKYCSRSSYGNNGFTDNKTVLDPEDDAATVNWGGAWRMPTKAEQDELRNNCTWDRTTQNGVNGYEVTGPNGNSIFLPAAGYMLKGTPGNAGSSSYYWSSSLYTGNPECAYSVNFPLLGDVEGIRDFGQSVRPVCP